MRVTYEAGDVDRLVKEALVLGTADTLVAAGGGVCSFGCM